MNRLDQNELRSATLYEGIYISIANQRLSLSIAGEKKLCLPVSTSKNAPSCLYNSFGTPWGHHAICEKIGEGEPSGTVFKRRVSTGVCFLEHPDNDTDSLITSRILRLEGLESGLNKGDPNDSFRRCIYIHGTNRGAFIGTPVSQGCINMLNIDVIELFRHVQVGTQVWIDLN